MKRVNFEFGIVANMKGLIEATTAIIVSKIHIIFNVRFQFVRIIRSYPRSANT